MYINLSPIPTPLQPYVECIRTIEHDSKNCSEIDVYLNGMPGIVFQHLDGTAPLKHITTRSGQVENSSTLYIYGQATNVSKMTYVEGRFTTIQFVLKPDALYSLMGIAASLLTNQVADLYDIYANDLQSRLFDAGSSKHAVALLNQFLISLLDSSQLTDDLVKHGLYLMDQYIYRLQIKELIQELNVSERQFERRFKQSVGITPKFYMRVKRFNSAIRLMNSGQLGSLTEIAHHLNYHDQSHFIRDARAFANLSPKLLTQRLDNPHPEQTVFSYKVR